MGAVRPIPDAQRKPEVVKRAYRWPWTESIGGLGSDRCCPSW